MKKPVMLKNDVVVIGATIAVSTIVTTVGAFAAYRFGRKSEIDEIIDIVKDQGIVNFKFYPKNIDKFVAITMNLVDGD